jgi:hypothetical protein
MADNARLLYELSAAQSTLWQQGGPVAVAMQQQLAELHRQGGFGFYTAMEVVHPDGMLAAYHTTERETPAPATLQGIPVLASEQSQASVDSQAPAIERAQAQTADLGRAEGTLIETATITAYQMSANESAAWSRGDHEARMVEANIGDALKDVGTHQPVAVLLDDGRAMYTHGSTMFQDMSAALGLLRDRLSALASGVQVHLDFSVQLGRPQPTAKAGLEALQERAEQLTARQPQHSREQGQSY